MWAGCFSSSECDCIVEQGLKRPMHPATIRNGNVVLSDDTYRRTNIRWFDRLDSDISWVITKIEHAVRLANRNAFQFDINYFHEIQFGEYTEEQKGKYDWHQDIQWVSNDISQRKLSIFIQLSEAQGYVGGDVEIDAAAIGGSSQLPPVEVMREKGTAFMFPSFLNHRVTPVVHGTRYSLVTWYEGPPFR